MLTIRELEVRYGAFRALAGISLEVGRGELVALLGPNGAGKSSLIGAILGLSRATHGSIVFAGGTTIGVPADRLVARGISLVAEGRGVIGGLTVAENLELGGFHLPRRKVIARVDEFASRFPILGARLRQPAGTLSGGQQQLLAIARALVSDPALLILDEPSLGLSPIAVHDVFSLIRELHEGGQTILLAEQDAHQALRVADRGYVLEAGTLVAQGTSQNLLRSQHVQAAYLGIA